MRTGSLLLLAVAAFTASAIAQEIVIGPTNGRAQPTSHSRPAAVQPIPAETRKSPAKSSAKIEAKPETQRSATSKSAKKAGLKQVAAKVKTPAVATTPSLSPETAAAEIPEVVPEAKKMPARPEWAMTDSRDARSLQVEIASALAGDPKLAGSSIHVNVDEGAVTLEGRATGTEERLQAQRLTQSYAWNRKLVDHIEVVRTTPLQK